MTAADPLSELLACPRCDKSPLASRKQHYYCSACKVSFPSPGSIPWLFAEPDATLGEWRNRLQFALQQLASDAHRIKVELEAKSLAPLTIKRLKLQMQAADEHRKTLRELLEPVDIQSLQGSHETYLALRTRLPGDQGIQTYYANIHRDWCWGDAENEASLKQIRAVLDGRDDAPGTTLVLGAGACRLAYDLHMQLAPTRTIAMDFNPLLLLLAKRLVAGEKAQFYEFPLAPKTIDDFAILRTLSAPQPVRDGFHLVFGDALRPPFAAGGFDTVVTPWLIDIVNDDLPLQAARINRLLKEGGRWINFGSLAFDHPQPSRRYSAEETVAIVESAGFAAPNVVEESIPYMCSPSSRHARSETVFTFAASKQANVKAAARHKALPDWIVTGKEAVPLTHSFRKQAVSTQIHSYIMSLINGKRTIRDMAAILEQQKLMTSAEAEPAIRKFLTRMYDDSQRNAGF
jgi:uncharacterized protein YbaR (Trm112 family)